ncbi:hypothetical protein [Deinococcus radiotolerans]|uniref:Uncharacterized protein n=1 Tax=Deinococcus radiotolerans TaxID=1309407 RepID=A0ABQ2FPA5_9DEIO|nr:hypothetical protein [Deinococcus radiotolerans]GGL13325.1 hypothetical protein GCM10010844_35200 [Deinococcus radiotolerans]
MRRLVPLACALLLGSALADTAEGTYDVRRYLRDGQVETSTLRVTVSGKGLTFDWDGGKVTGLGLRVGDAVAVAYGNPDCGIALYEQQGNVFSGVWTYSGQATGTETFTWDGLKSARVAVRGQNPDGSTYTGELLLPLDQGASLPRWKIGTEVTDGAGLLEDGLFAVAFGSERCNVALYSVIELTGQLLGTFFQVTVTDTLPERVAEIAVRR